MSKSLNLCQFIGNMGSDPEQTFMPNGNAVSKFSIGVSDDYKDKNTGQKVEQTNWIRCVAFGNLAEIIGQYCKKGSKVYISGKQVTRSWQDQQNQTRYSTEIVVGDLQMLDSRPQGQQVQQQDYRGHAGSNQHNPTYGQQAAPPSQPQAQPSPDFDGFEDNIPF